MRKRLLVLPISAVVIVGLCFYKLSRSYDPRPFVPIQHVSLRTVSPDSGLLFELYDQKSELVKLSRYVGRHEIVLVFFDGAAGVHKNSTMQLLAENIDRLATDLIIVGVSDVLPQVNERFLKQWNADRERQRLPELRFVLLSDVDFSPDGPRDKWKVHRQWRRYDAATKQSLTGGFFIDRKGQVAWGPGGPVAITDPKQLLDRLLATK